MAATNETPATAPPPRAILGLRVVLALQFAILSLGAIWVYALLLDLEGMSFGFGTADAYAMTAEYIWLVVPQAAVHLLAAVQIGRTRWGALLLVASMAGSVIQIVKLMPFVPFAAPFIIALFLELAFLAKESTRERIRTGGTPRRAYLPELIVVPAAAAVIVSLLVWNGQVNDVDNRHPERTFDGSEAPGLLEEAIVDPLAAVEGVEGFKPSYDHRASTIECLDRDSLDEEWSEYSLIYWFDEKIATSGPGAAAIDAMREHLQENGWEITFDEEIFIAEEIEPGHIITAEREDGVWIEFEVADATTMLAVHSGCVPNAD
jgi:hypothetical protein